MDHQKFDSVEAQCPETSDECRGNGIAASCARRIANKKLYYF